MKLTATRRPLKSTKENLFGRVKISYAFLINFEIGDNQFGFTRIQCGCLNTYEREIREMGRFSVRRRGQTPAEYFWSSDTIQNDMSTRIIALEIIPPYFQRVTGTRNLTDKKTASSTQSHLAVNPFSRLLSAFAQTYDVLVRIRRKGRKNFSLYEGAYVVTRDEHRDRQVGWGMKGERFGGVPGKLALELFDSINLPSTPCISPSRSPFLACTLTRCFSFPSFHSSECCSKWNAEDLSISTFHQ